MSTDRQAIEAIIAAAQTTGLVAYSGEVWLASWKKSTSTKTPQVTFTVAEDEELAPFEGATIFKGRRAGQRYVILAFEIGDDESVVAQDQHLVIHDVDLSVSTPAYTGEIPVFKAQSAPSGPFALYASSLHKNGWFFSRKVLEAIGTDAEFREWVRHQSCVVCGSGDLVEQTGELLCEAAHVNRPSGDSGLGLKVDYSCVSLCRRHHAYQHQHGVPALYELFRLQTDTDTDQSRAAAFDWLDKERDSKLKQWATTTLKAMLGYSSFTLVPPDELHEWAKAHGIADTLPACYRS